MEGIHCHSSSLIGYLIVIMLEVPWSKNGSSQEKVDSKPQGGIQRLLLLSS